MRVKKIKQHPETNTVIVDGNILTLRNSISGMIGKGNFIMFYNFDHDAFTVKCNDDTIYTMLLIHMDWHNGNYS